MTHVAAALSLAGTAGCCACLVYLHLAPTGLSPVRDAVSAYGVGGYARWYQAQAMCAGLAGILLAVALRQRAGVAALLVVFGLARFAITQFSLETPRAHVRLAALAFATVAGAGIHLTAHQHGTPAFGWAMLVFALGTGVALRSQLRPWLGLIERAFYVAMLAWLALVAIRLL